ncbi:MAG: ABC transporter ATP-binding protein [Clostridia bacterium]|nr:ABC transporter ATP-binding protein [Clostridia bacterium]
MGPGFGRHGNMDKYKTPKPENLGDVPRYLKELIGGFFYRLFYIFKLVWESGPWILFVMVFMAIFDGVMPVIGASITANILNSLMGAYNTLEVGSTLKEQITEMLNNEACRMIVFWLVMQFAFTFIKSLVNNINNILKNIYGELVVNHIKLMIMNKSKEVDLASFDTPEFYEKLENANREAGHRPIQIMHATFNVFSTIISMVSFIAILAAVSVWAPVIITVLAIPSAIINFIYRRKHAMYVRFRSKDRRIMSYYSGQLTTKEKVKEIKLYGLSDLFIDRYNVTFKRYYKGLRRLFMEEGIWHIILTIIRAGTNCALFVYIALQVCNGSQEIGNYSLYVSALNHIATGVGTFISTTATIYEGTLFIDNMIAFMKNERTILPSIPAPVPVQRHTAHTIVFDHVSFSYPGTEREVIKDVSFTINQGETVVLVGLNGAGKTTLIKLLTRLYDPTKGHIYLDGRDIREYKVEELYDMFGIIFQDFGRYAVSVTENITFGNIGKDVDSEDVKEAAVASNSADFIEELPNKYETPLTRMFEENGIDLSGGQWQKLAIARAFYSDSDVLILDEPTASLDPMAEQEIFNRFDELRKDKTSIFVSHRLSSATTADKILVLEYGQLIETGSHAQLMAQKGKYYELFSTQARRYIESAGAIDEAPDSYDDRRGGFGDMPSFRGDGFDDDESGFGGSGFRGEGGPRGFGGGRPPMHRPPRNDGNK